MKFNYDFWHWNNGKWHQSYPDFYGSIIINCFGTREAQADCGRLIIDGQLIKTGAELGATNYSEGEILLLKYAIENKLAKN